MTNVPRTDAAIDGTSALQADEEATAATPIDERDGRSLRRKRNRDAVIAALIELIQEGELTPTVAKIADRAAVSHRSVFRYFDDLNDLARTAIETEFRKAWPLSVIANVGEGPLDERIGSLVASAIRTLQRTHLLGLVARSRAIDLEEVDRGLTTIYELRLDQVRRHFALELEQMDETQAETIAVAVAAATGLDSYDVQHRMMGRPSDEVAEMWRTTIRALLA
jgi:TetR/AcrR family transcriptional regulator of autoinduction and epiphytic fitness